MKTRTYPIVCPSCHGAGYIDNPEWDPNVTSSIMTIICPACGGNKTVIVTETETDDKLE